MNLWIFCAQTQAKNPPNEFYCTVYSVQCTQKPHRVTLRNHSSCIPNRINSVAWLYAVTSTPYHDFTQSHKLRTMNERRHTNSVPWMYAVCRLRQVTFIQFNQRIFWANCVHSWYGVGVTAFIHGTELMRFGKVTLRSIKSSIQWLWPVKVTLNVIMRRPKVFCWSCDEGPLNWDKKIFRASSLPARIEWAYSRPPHQMVGQCL